MGYCSVCGNWVDEGDLCGCCGSSGGYDEEEEEELDNHITSQEYFYRQARTSSIKGDHSTAIKFYNEALRATWECGMKCDILAAIAGEYETIGDYASAEDCWNRCCDVEASGGYPYEYVIGKGDFLHRQGRYREAIGAYEQALNALNGLEDIAINPFKLKCYARIAHFIIDSYDKLGEDNREEKYHNELRHGIDRFLQTRERSADESKANILSETAWGLYSDEGLFEEALILMDSAIRLHPDCPADYYNTKAIILDGLCQYDEALKYYDIALSKDKGEKTFLKNKADCIREKLKLKLVLRQIEPRDLDLIDEALETLPEGYDDGPYLSVKKDILFELGEPVKARICSALSVKDYAKVERAENQLKKLKSSETYINITGTQFYRNFEPFKEGTIVDLVKEPDNPHDMNAIRVEIGGETVGYVANSRYTLIYEVKSASEIKNTKSTHAEVQFILFGEWVIAKLI